MKKDGHVISQILENSIAEEMGIESGDRLLQINGNDMIDVFDYQFFIQEEYIEVVIEKQNQEEWILEIDKEYYEDLGIVFENGLMDEYRSCKNKCIFCFIDQMPQGMRETLYFKDDDSRLSFLQGNYVTLTNMSDEDIDRIIRYRLEPINISFQTTNKQLRCSMLNNRFAGDALKKVDKLYEAGIAMNGQIVLCKGVNDGKELIKSIEDMLRYAPVLESVSIVPVGLSKYRDNLYPLEPFTKEDANEVLTIIHNYQTEAFQKHGIHFVHAGDEWYILAGQQLPDEGSYDGYLQLENGVGMLRLLLDEFEAGYQIEKLKIDKHITNKQVSNTKIPDNTVVDSQLAYTCSIATGHLAYPYIKHMAERMMELYPKLTIYVYPITNDFFGENITVSGLLTGQDIIKQLKGKELGQTLLLPQNVQRSGEDVFLDDITLSEMESALQVKIDIVKSSGQELIRKMKGE